MVIIIIIFIIIIGKAAIFEPQFSLEYSARFVLNQTIQTSLLWFRNNNFFKQECRQPCIQPPTWQPASTRGKLTSIGPFYFLILVTETRCLGSKLCFRHQILMDVGKQRLTLCNKPRNVRKYFPGDGSKTSLRNVLPAKIND